MSFHVLQLITFSSRLAFTSSHSLCMLSWGIFSVPVGLSNQVLLCGPSSARDPGGTGTDTCEGQKCFGERDGLGAWLHTKLRHHGVSIVGNFPWAVLPLGSDFVDRNGF